MYWACTDRRGTRSRPPTSTIRRDRWSRAYGVANERPAGIGEAWPGIGQAAAGLDQSDLMSSVGSSAHLDGEVRDVFPSLLGEREVGSAREFAIRGDGV